jgi:hypothetical protein
MEEEMDGGWYHPYKTAQEAEEQMLGGPRFKKPSALLGQKFRLVCHHLTQGRGLDASIVLTTIEEVNIHNTTLRIYLNIRGPFLSGKFSHLYFDERRGWVACWIDEGGVERNVIADKFEPL